MTVRVLICDDDSERVEFVEEKIQESGVDEISVERLVEKDLTDALKSLFSAAKKFVADPQHAELVSDESFGQGDVLLFDNNLADLEIEGARLTAESVVEYVRGFASSGYIVSLNKNLDVDFDLRYLMGDHETRADLAINNKHLSHRDLWRRKLANTETFVPWYWPELMAAPALRAQQIEEVVAALDQPVLRTLGFPEREDILRPLSPHAKSALWPGSGASDGDVEKLPTEVTFIEFFSASSHTIPATAERERLLKAVTDSSATEARLVIARVIAAEIDRWMRRDIVAPQEVLVDVPHLLLRMPFLLGHGASDLDAWNSAVRSSAPPYGLDEDLYRQYLAPHEFRGRLWYARPAFWWAPLKENQALGDLFFGAPVDWEDVVFCEDVSAFRFRGAGDDESPTEFGSDLEGAWARRHVVPLEGYHYRPINYLMR